MALSIGLQPALPLVTELPTNYDYYTSGGIKSGLSADQPYFTLNDRNISIFSGALHYFRVPRAYWRDRLRKMRAAGLNTVETYVPWNLHEYEKGVYDFGDGESDMQDFLNITEFLKTAQEEDLFAIVRSGPFICAEFEFGGFPSWLLHDKDIGRFRSSDSVYMKYVSKFFNVLMPILAMLQFTVGGPVISLQVENEYAIMGSKADYDYLRGLRQLMLDNGIVELLVTADNPSKGSIGSIPELFLLTGNFNSEPTDQLNMLQQLQPGKPLMTMEYYPGWFDFWGQEHHTKDGNTFITTLEEIINYPSSVNIYMFHGGTNFGFLNGATNNDNENSAFEPVTTSYDYDAPLTEAGDYSEKYYMIRELLSNYSSVQTKLPDIPELVPRIVYPKISVTQQLPLQNLLQFIEPQYYSKVSDMEELNINENSGQSFGYIVYRKENINLEANSELLIEGRVCDTVMVLVNGVLISPFLETSTDLDNYGTWRTKDSKITLTTEELENATLDLVVENWGRVNNHVYQQYKGIFQGNIRINGVILEDWQIFPLEFKKSWSNSLENWISFEPSTVGPSLYKTTLEIEKEPTDIFVYMENWIKGIVIVNGFVIGRYAKMGPIQTLYLPAPFLKQGNNEIIIFEHFKPGKEVVFTIDNIYVSY